MKPVSENRGVAAQPPPWTGPVATSERALPFDLTGFLTREQHRIHLVGVEFHFSPRKFLFVA